MGSYLECAAYNPSLPPLQTALVNIIVNGNGPNGNYEYIWNNICEVVLVELSEAAVQHVNVTKVVLSAIAPKATLLIAPLI